MNLLPQDVVILLKLKLSASESWTYNGIAYELKMSPSMVHSAIRRASNANLFVEHRRQVNVKSLTEFLVHGVKYAFAPRLGSVTRGVPTGFASPLLKERIQTGDSELFVWPHPMGNERGIELEPLYKSVPEISLEDDRMYGALGAVDALRKGRVREQTVAAKALAELLGRS